MTRQKVDKKEQPGIEELRALPKAPKDIAREVAKVYKVEEAKLYRKRSVYREARSVFIELCRKYLTRKMPVAELGRMLGGVGGAALSHNRARLEERIKKDKVLRQRYWAIEKKLK